jgi:hypothetical protein
MLRECYRTATVREPVLVPIFSRVLKESVPQHRTIELKHLRLSPDNQILDHRFVVLDILLSNSAPRP